MIHPTRMTRVEYHRANFFSRKTNHRIEKYQRLKPDGSSIRQNNQRHYNDYIEVRFKYCHNNKSSVSWTLKKTHTETPRVTHFYTHAFSASELEGDHVFEREKERNIRNYNVWPKPDRWAQSIAVLNRDYRMKIIEIQ